MSKNFRVTNKYDRLKQIVETLKHGLDETEDDCDDLDIGQWREFFEETVETEGYHWSEPEIFSISQFMMAKNQDDESQALSAAQSRIEDLVAILLSDRDAKPGEIKDMLFKVVEKVEEINKEIKANE
jgi:uncharacterized protein Yka (UPF0111/DUF47 family)